MFASNLIRVRLDLRRAEPRYWLYVLPVFRREVWTPVVGYAVPPLRAIHRAARYIEPVCPPPTPRRAARHRARARRARRQDRAEPAHERDARGDGAGALPVVVRGLRPGAREGRGPALGPPARPRRAVPRVVRALGAGGDTGGVGGDPSGRSDDCARREHAQHQGTGLLGRRPLLCDAQGPVQATGANPRLDGASADGRRDRADSFRAPAAGNGTALVARANRVPRQ